MSTQQSTEIARLFRMVLVMGAACAVLSAGCSRQTGALVDSASPSTTAAEPCTRSLPQEAFTGQVDVTGSRSVFIWTVNYQMTVTSKMSYEVGPTTAALAVNSQITAFSVAPQLAYNRALAEASAQATGGNGTRAIELAPVAELAALGQTNAAYANMPCAIIPTTQQTFVYDSAQMVVTYDPPLPLILNPAASSAQVAAEIGRGRTWPNITATIARSANPAFPAGSTFRGRVNLTPRTTSAGQEYRFDFQFAMASPEDVQALGVAPFSSYSLNPQNHNYSSVTFGTYQESTPGQDMVYKP